MSTGKSSTSNQLAFIRHAGASATGNAAIVPTYLRGLPALVVVTTAQIMQEEEIFFSHGNEQYCTPPVRSLNCPSSASECKTEGSGSDNAVVRCGVVSCEEVASEGRRDGYQKMRGKSWATAPCFLALSRKAKSELKMCTLPGAAVRPITSAEHPANGQVCPACDPWPQPLRLSLASIQQADTVPAIRTRCLRRQAGTRGRCWESTAGAWKQGCIQEPTLRACSAIKGTRGQAACARCWSHQRCWASMHSAPATRCG